VTGEVVMTIGEFEFKHQTNRGASLRPERWLYRRIGTDRHWSEPSWVWAAVLDETARLTARTVELEASDRAFREFVRSHANCVTTYRVGCHEADWIVDELTAANQSETPPVGEGQ